MPAFHADAFVFFGATGDLAQNKIFPTLAALVRAGRLDMPIVGVARSPLSLDEFRARTQEPQRKKGPVDEDTWQQLSRQLRYIDGDYRKAETFKRLRKEFGSALHPLHYLAIPPSMFGPVLEGLGGTGCTEGAGVIVEKPFGRDLESAQALNRTVHTHSPESSVFRIDHYLGKEAVQNLLYFRFANAFVEPLWNRIYVDSVQAPASESLSPQSKPRNRGEHERDERGAIRTRIQGSSDD